MLPMSLASFISGALRQDSPISFEHTRPAVRFGVTDRVPVVGGLSGMPEHLTLTRSTHTALSKRPVRRLTGSRALCARVGRGGGDHLRGDVGAIPRSRRLLRAPSTPST